MPRPATAPATGKMSKMEQILLKKKAKAKAKKSTASSTKIMTPAEVFAAVEAKKPTASPKKTQFNKKGADSDKPAPAKIGGPKPGALGKKGLTKPTGVTKKKTAKKAKVSASEARKGLGKTITDPSAVIPVVTSAALKRVALRMGISQISAEAVKAIKEYVTEQANLCLLQSRSCAHYVSRTRTVHSKDLASAARNTALGDVVCVLARIF